MASGPAGAAELSASTAQRPSRPWLHIRAMLAADCGRPFAQPCASSEVIDGPSPPGSSVHEARASASRQVEPAVVSKPLREFAKLLAFLQRVPAMKQPIGSGRFEDGTWWVKFGLDIHHPLAWQVVQELGCILNYLSLEERLPTVFMPVSPAPDLNGGPENFLSWVIESTDPSFRPNHAARWLTGRLPDPVDDPSQWQSRDDDE